MDQAAPRSEWITVREVQKMLSLGRSKTYEILSQEEGIETVQLGTDGPIDVADGDSPAEFDVLAEAGEDREIRLLESGRTIGRLVTQP